MASAKDKLTPKPAAPKPQMAGSVQLQVQPPVVKVGAPQVKVDIPAPQLNMDTKPFADVISQLGQTMARLAQQQLAILSAIEQQTEALRQLATRSDPVIKVPETVVKMAARPRDFYVELDKEGGETIGMRISAQSPH